MREKILEALEEVRKTLQLHNGGIELDSWDNESGELVLRLTGACVGCALSAITVKNGVEVILCERVPQIQKIITL